MLRLRSTAVFLVLLLCFFVGCGKKTPGAVRPEEGKKPVVRLIAVLPVENKSSDAQAARILRERILEEIFFKGYPKIPLSVLDEKLSGSYKDGAKAPPKIVGDLLKVDAVFYCTLEEWKTTYGLVSARTTVSARFEMRDAKTGETIWKARGKETRKNYDVTRKGQEMKSFLDYEQLVAEIVDKAMASFPDGPDFIGRPPAKKGCWLWNWF